MKFIKISFIKNILLKSKFVITRVFLIKVIYLFSSLGITYITGLYVNVLVSNLEIGRILKYTSILIFLTLMNILFGYLSTMSYNKTQADMVFDINFTVLKHIKKIPLSFFTGKDPVYLNQRINEDSNTVVNFLLTAVCGTMISVLSFCFVVFILFSVNSFLAFVALFSIPLYILIYYIFEKKLCETTLDYKEQQNEFFACMFRQLNNPKFIKLKAIFEILDEELKQKYSTFFRSIFIYFKYNFFFKSMSDLLGGGYNIFLYIYSAYAIYHKTMNVGEFIIIKSYYTLLLQTISQIIGILKSYPNMIVSTKRLKEILDIEEEQNGIQLLDSINSIKIENFTFSYKSKTIFSKFVFEFTKGNVYLIKGDNGSGKSTLINNILGLYINEYQGEIFYNNSTIKALNLYYLRKHNISVTEQEPTLLYENNLEKNIYVNSQDIKSKVVEELLVGFGLMNLSNSCSSYSGGEKQKVSLLTSIARNPDVLVLDEPTSALDAKSVTFLISKIDAIKKDKIILIISHDNRLDSLANKIINLD